MNTVKVSIETMTILIYKMYDAGLTELYDIQLLEHRSIRLREAYFKTKLIQNSNTSSSSNKL